MKRWPRRLLPSLALLLLLGCASSPEEEAPTIDPLEQNLLDAFETRAYWLIPQAMSAARSRYESLDELGGQWRVTKLAAQYALARGEVDAAKVEARRLDRLRQQMDAPTRRELDADFETDIIVGRALGDEAAFRRVVSRADDPIDRAVALTYLNETERAAALLDDGRQRAADRAFVLYRAGLAAARSDLLQNALDMYRLAGDSRGVADTLFALARLAAGAGDRERAGAFADRARRALLAIGDDERAGAVAAWLDRQ